jgi:hypothetical protein
MQGEEEWTDTIAVNLLFLPDKLAGDIRGTTSIPDSLASKIA